MGGKVPQLSLSFRIGADNPQSSPQISKRHSAHGVIFCRLSSQMTSSLIEWNKILSEEVTHNESTY